jgi:hypothetical protein
LALDYPLFCVKDRSGIELGIVDLSKSITKPL